MKMRDSFQRGKTVERLKPFFSSMSREAASSKWQFNATPRAIIIDKDLSRFDFFGESHLPRALLRPEARHQAVVCSIGDLERLLLGFKGDHHLNWSKDLILCQNMIWGNIPKQMRRDIGTVLGCIARNLTLCRER